MINEGDGMKCFDLFDLFFFFAAVNQFIVSDEVDIKPLVIFSVKVWNLVINMKDWVQVYLCEVTDSAGLRCI